MKILLLFLLTVCSFCAIAQKSFFGVEAGINVANQRAHWSIDNNYYYNYYGNTINEPQITTAFFQNVVKPSAGVFYHFGLGKKTGIRVKAQYQGLGYKSKSGILTDHVDINYLTFPVTFHYSITPRIAFFSGPYLSFTLGGSDINQKNITSYYHKNDYGFNVGIEYDVYKNLAVSLGYLVGLKNVWLDDHMAVPYNGTVGNIKYTNRALQFAVIYKFKKKTN